MPVSLEVLHMRIEIEDSVTGESEVVDTEISSEDVESTKDKSNEAVHKNEINLRTVQFQDSYNKSVSDSSSRETSVSKTKIRGGGVSSPFGGGSCSKTNSTTKTSKFAKSHSSSYGETKTKWKDVLFKNNSNRNGWSLKSNSASRNARNMRSEARNKTTNSYIIKPNAGYVRAALYITNHTVNMPVKVTDILCSFMLESPDGQLLPVQSFRLRNDDYSIFSIELYGETTFGPYVIELSNLNTQEIKDAINRGYNPKIFLIDYKMRHVADSIYRLSLNDSFTGDNLKIIEENAKGRTAGVKILGPGMRDFYRVVAFDTDAVNENRTTQTEDVTNIKPGVTLVWHKGFYH